MSHSSSRSLRVSRFLLANQVDRGSSPTNGATMALILLSIIPVIVFYLTCQKHIIKGVAAGAVKG